MTKSVDNWYWGDCTVVEKYLQVCKKAVSDDSVFENFKNNAEYVPVLEHTTTNQAKIYSNKMKSESDFVEKCKINDKLGNPSLMNDENFGMISPSTMRYAFFVAKIKNFLDDSLNSILDIGGGYGGMSLISANTLDTSKIYLNDLPDVLALQTKYLNRHNLKPVFASDNIEDFYNKKIDLCVSTFAFSELTKSQREKIIQNVFPNCRYVFLVCNFINTEMFQDIELDVMKEKSEKFEFYKEDHENHSCSVFLIKTVK